MNLLDKEKTFSTPIQVDDEIIREVVRNTESAGEWALRWGANELGGPGT